MSCYNTLRQGGDAIKQYGGTKHRALPRHQSKEIKILNISFRRMAIEPIPCRVYSLSLCRCATIDLNEMNTYIYYILEVKSQMSYVHTVHDDFEGFCLNLYNFLLDCFKGGLNF